MIHRFALQTNNMENRAFSETNVYDKIISILTNNCLFYLKFGTNLTKILLYIPFDVFHKLVLIGNN